MRSSVPIVLLLLALGAGIGLRIGLQEAPAAAGGAAAAGEGPPQGHVYCGVAEQPDDVNPLTAHSLVAQRILSQTHDGLLDCDPTTGALRPALASAWELAADGGSCTFTLRPDVRFADGAAVSLDDVLFAWELAKGGALPLGFAGIAFDHVAAVEGLDAHRFRVQFRGRHYAAVQVVGEYWPVVHRRWFEQRVAEAAARAGIETPLPATAAFAQLLGQIDDECGPGTGPYVLQNRPGGPSGWRRGHELVLSRNEYCWRRTARPGTWNFAGLRYLFLDPAAATSALLRGELDWYSSPLVDDLLQARPELGERYQRVEYDYRQLGVYRIAWNCARPPFDDPRLRRALARLLDLDKVRRVFGGHGVPARAFAKPDSPEYPRHLEPLSCDLPQARAELRAAGFGAELGRPLRLVLLAPEGPEPVRRTLDLFADAARQVGIDLDLRVREWSVFVAEKAQGGWDGLFVHQAFRAWGDPYDFVHSGSDDNLGGWSHPDADRLATAARAELDAGRRTALWRELHELVYREQPTCFVLHPRVTLLLGRHVQGAVPGPLGLSIEGAFVAPEHQRP